MIAFAIFLVLSLSMSSAWSKNAETRNTVRQLMEDQGYKFYGFSYDYGTNVSNITSGQIFPDRPLRKMAIDVPESNVTDSRLQKRACAGRKSTCGESIFFGADFTLGGTSAVVLDTNGCTESATNDDILFCIDKRCVWLDNFLCNDFERGEGNAFFLPPQFRILSDSIVILEKFGNQLWQVRPFEIIITTAPGQFREFLFDDSLASFPRNCNCGFVGRGLTMNDDPASCNNIFNKGGCPRGYTFRLRNGLLFPTGFIGGS